MLIQNYRLKPQIALFATCLATMYMLNISEVNAQGVSVTTYPSTIRLFAQPATTASSKFTVANNASETVKLEVMLKPFKADAANDGKVLYVEGNDPAILKRIEIIDKGLPVDVIEIGPKQSKQLELRIKANEKEPPADYYFSIILLAANSGVEDQVQNEATAYSIAQAGIAINVLLATGPKELPVGYLEEFSTAFYRDAGPVPFTVKIKNRGPHYMTPKGVILIKNIFGQTVGRIDIQNENILAGTSRSLSSILHAKSANMNTDDLQKLVPQYAVWPEKFLLGFYTADLSIALSEEGPVFNQTVRFAAFPTKLLISLAIMVTIALLVTIRIRRKLRDS